MTARLAGNQLPNPRKPNLFPDAPDRRRFATGLVVIGLVLALTEAVMDIVDVISDRRVRYDTHGRHVHDTYWPAYVYLAPVLLAAVVIALLAVWFVGLPSLWRPQTFPSAWHARVERRYRSFSPEKRAELRPGYDAVMVATTEDGTRDAGNLFDQIAAQYDANQALTVHDVEAEFLATARLSLEHMRGVADELKNINDCAAARRAKLLGEDSK